MKAAANGVLNLSVLDGWWAEAYNNSVGWAIGRGEEYEDPHLHDEVESYAIYNLLEQEIIPLFYNRGNDGLPRGWINLMKNSMRIICPFFNTNRMVEEYNRTFYRKCHAKWIKMLSDNSQKAKELAEWKQHIRDNWQVIKIEDITTYTNEEVKVGSEIEIYAHIYLGEIDPESVSVEIYEGEVNQRGMIDKGYVHKMSCCNVHENGLYTFVGTVSCSTTGLQGYTIRILPKHEDMANPYQINLITWGA